MIKDKEIILGTAMWGWTIKKEECFKLLDLFYDEGYRYIDVAPNYPINNDQKYFRYAENILLEWINSNKVVDLKIITKIGSYDNTGTSKNNLSFSFILMNFNYYEDKFGKNLDNIMVHWDNRGSRSSIFSTIEALELIKLRGVNIGLSGIKNPELYFESKSKTILKCTFELKHNIFSSTYDRYKKFHKTSNFFIYGINENGIKINKVYKAKSNLVVRGKNQNLKRYDDTLKKIDKYIIRYSEFKDWEIKTFNQIGMIYGYNTPWVNGVIVGPTNLSKLKDTIRFYKQLVLKDSGNIYKAIKKILF